MFRFILFGMIFLEICFWEIDGFIHSSAASGAKEQLVIDDEAIEKLSEVFDIPGIKRKREPRADYLAGRNGSWEAGPASGEQWMPRDKADQHHRPEPPQYMINLYNTIADRNGIMRIPNPYHANLIKSFPNKGLTGQPLFFDLTSVHSQEKILQAELHFELTPSMDYFSCDNHLILKIFLISSKPHRRRLVISRIIPCTPQSNISYVVQLRDVGRDWIENPQRNHGLEIVTVADRKDSSGQPVAYSTTKEANKMPTLILFMDDGRPGRNPKYRINDLAKQSQFIKTRLTRLGQSDIYRSYSSDLRNISPMQIQQTTNRSTPSPFLNRIRRSRLAKGSGNSVSQKLKNPHGPRKPRKPKGACRRHELYVSFKDIGWSSWIISPRGFQAFHCRGTCRFPIGQESKPSNHATIISIMNTIKPEITAPCCVPEKLYSTSLLYFDNEQNVILKQYDDMVAQSCACR